MPAIQYAEHQRFCIIMEAFRVSHAPDDQNLAELESELDNFFRNYQESVEEVKSIINKYNRKQKEIRQRMKEMLRNKAIAKPRFNSILPLTEPG